MEPFKTRKGQTVLEVSKEFVAAVANAKSGGKDGEDLFDFYVELEKQNVINDDISNAIHNIGINKFDAYELPIFRNLKPKISEVLIAWVAMQSQGIPAFITTYLGLYGAVFWSTHSRDEKMTLAWIGEQGARGKLLTFDSVFPWFIASQTESRESVFATMPPETFYLKN